MAVFFLYLAGAIVFTYPLILDLSHTVADLADSLLDAWALAWVPHQLLRDPLRLFDSNRFYPATNTLAFTDPMIGLAILASPIQLLFDDPVLTLNIAMLSAIALSGLGGYLLVKDISGSVAGGAVAGAVFAFNPYRLNHLEHVQLQAAGFIPLLYLCVRRHLREGGTRYAVGAGVFLWLVSASCAYYGVFTWMLLCIAIPYEVWRTSAHRRRRRWMGLLGALILSGAAYLPVAAAFTKLDRDYGFHRPPDRLQRASARPGDYLRSGSHLHRSAGLKPPSPERTLFPGLLALALAAVAVVLLNRDTGLYVLLGFAATWASLGPAYGLYRVLYAVVPGLSGLRVPPRVSIYVLFSLCVLAGWAAGFLSHKTPRKARPFFVAAMAVFPLVESFGGPVPYTRAPDPPEIYDWLAEQADPAPVVELPLAEANSGDIHRNAIYVFWSTSHFKPIANGYATLIPPVYAELVQDMEDFPHADGVEALRRLRIRYVILHRDLYLRHRAHELEAAMDRQAGLRRAHRTRYETAYEVTRPTPSRGPGSDSKN